MYWSEPEQGYDEGAWEKWVDLKYVYNAKAKGSGDLFDLWAEREGEIEYSQDHGLSRKTQIGNPI